MEEIFRLEYHPIERRPRRIRFLVRCDSNQIERITERETRDDWERIETQVIDYFEYSDE